MAELVAGLLGPAIEVVRWIGAPIMRQFNYLCCFTANITSLDLEARKLDDTTGGIQGRVDRERDNVRVIVPEVETWLKNSKDIKDEANGILHEATNLESGCLKVRARFSLSRRAKKITDGIKELRGQGSFDVISHPGPPPAQTTTPLGVNTYEFESRKQIEEDIMTSLRGGDLNMIGICGMGGLGKTTMAKMIMNRALKDHLFDEAVMAVVSQPVDKLKIQLDIGGALGLKDVKEETSEADRVQKLHERLTGGALGLKDLKEETSEAERVQKLHERLTGGSLGLDLKGVTSEAERVQKLHERLTGGSLGLDLKGITSEAERPKRILLVLDDVWEKLELEELGIPCGSKGCTILLTSRNNDVLSEMNVEKIFGMKVLSQEDAWHLFKRRAGTCVDDTRLNSLAKKVVEECKGLPIALTTVGAALKEKNDARIWEDALQQLKQGNPDIRGIIAKVYNPLKLSYDALDSKHAKSIFLLCCLFPEDVNICLTYLTCFCMGLGILEGISNLKAARNRIRTLIETLKDRSLLLDGRNEDYVRMHDVVRDVSIFIAKKEGYIGDNECTWISSSFQFVRERDELPARLRNLRLLFLSRNPMDEEFKLDNTFLEGIRELSVLSIENYSSIITPRTTESLRNLNTLILDSSSSLWTLSAVGKLVNLEILICRDCNSIQELPPEIKGLNGLKLLELTRCGRLQRIDPGIISSLVQLEELKMMGSFKNWGILEGENVNAGMTELKALTNLTCLEIEIVNPAFVVEKRQLSSKLERFQISIHAVADVKPSPVRDPLERAIEHRILRAIEDHIHLCWDREMKEEWEGARFDKKMSVRGWGAGTHFISDWVERTECLLLIGINATNVDLAKTQNIRWLEMYKCETMKNIAIVCPFIERLKLYSLPELEEILDGPISSNSFQNLRKLNLEDLPALKKLWKSSSSPVLSSIRIVNCPKLEEILHGPISSNSFHNLKKLNLERLPALKQLWKSSSLHQNNYVPVFSNLSSIVIKKCPHLPNLGQLSISGVGCLPQLQILRVSECEMMKEVFLWDEFDENKNNNELPNHHITKSFPNLIQVELSDLPNLAIFCQGIEAIKFPLLTEMSIKECPKMTSMVSSNENNSGATSNPDIDDDHSSHLFCQPQKMSFGSLKKLFTSQNPFCGHKIPAVSSFNGLEMLEIRWYHGGMRLCSPSIARDLVSLKTLNICFCNEMVKVIEDEKEKENVLSGGAQSTTTILFPKLKELELWNLSKLVSFCEWKCDVELPSLTKVVIKECHNMEKFNLGSLITPKLEIVKINGDDFDATNDLNGALLQHLTGAKEKQQKEMEEEQRKTATEEGRRGEIEEEPNS